MSYRRRDPAPAAYSSADAYRSLPSTSPSLAHAQAAASTSSDEDAHLASTVISPQSASSPIAASFVRQRSGSGARARVRREGSLAGNEERDIAEGKPLSPPRPQYLGGDRRSWGSSTGTTDQEQSDSDGSAANFAGVGSGGQRPPSVDYSNGNNGAARVPPRGNERSRAVTQPVQARQATAAARARNHTRRRSSMANEYAYSGSATAAAIATVGEDDVSSNGHTSPVSSTAHGNPFGTPNDTPRNSFYGAQAYVEKGKESGAKLPPSSYAFPFQSHPGNPDPGLAVPGAARRTSIESLRARSSSSPPNGAAGLSPNNTGAGLAGAVNATNNNPLTPPGSATGTVYPAGVSGSGGYGLLNDAEELARPYAPFMGDAERSQTPPSPMASQSQLYRGSAAGAMQYGEGAPGLPRTSSIPAMSMRAPFLSPASRPTSSLWAPPSFPYAYPPASGSSSALNTYVGSGSGSGLYAGQYSSYADIQAQLRKAKPIMPSSKIPAKLTVEEKPWMASKGGRARASYWLTIAGMLAGVAGAAILCYFSWTSVLLLNNNDLCQVLSEDWSNGYTDNWTLDVEMSGFGNGEFQMTTDSSDNIYTQNNELYIMPTLTSDEIGTGAIFDGSTYKLSGCTTTSTNASACQVTPSNKTGQVVPPVKAARLSTRGKSTIKYGRVEVVAKLPQGDWLWPAIWMLPENNTYGNWPMSGEIDLMEARGNAPSYPAQGTNYVRASLNYGVLPGLQTHLFGWWEDKQAPYSQEFHTYALEWTDSWMRLYVDSRLQAMMNLKIQGKGGKSFFDIGKYPSTATNGSNTEVVVENIWQQAGGGPNAPYDQEFYLILDLAAGGTSGWFPDNVGNKPWYDASPTAMREFAEAQKTWYATWPSDADDRAFRVSSVKMWKLGQC